MHRLRIIFTCQTNHFLVMFISASPPHFGNYVGIGSVTKDKLKLVFSTSNSTNPELTLYDLEKQEIRFLADFNSSVKSLALEKTEPFSFSARDGLRCTACLRLELMVMIWVLSF